MRHLTNDKAIATLPILQGLLQQCAGRGLAKLELDEFACGVKARVFVELRMRLVPEFGQDEAGQRRQVLKITVALAGANQGHVSEGPAGIESAKDFLENLSEWLEERVDSLPSKPRFHAAYEAAILASSTEGAGAAGKSGRL